KLGSALRRRQFISFSSAYHSERTSSSVSSEMIASTSHSANSRMLLAQFPVRQFELRNHPCRRRFAPISELIPRIAKKSQRDRRVEIVDCHEHVREKRRDHVSLLRRMFAQLGERLTLKPRNFQLDIKKCPIRKLPQNHFQSRQHQAFRNRLLNRHPTNRRVMANHGLPIGGKAHVKLKPVAPVL